MVILKLSEPELNQLGAALDARNLQLSAQLNRLVTQPESSDRDFALDCTRDAIREIISVRLLIAQAVEEPEPDSTVTMHSEYHGEEPQPLTCQRCRDENDYFARYGWHMSEGEARALWGDR